MKILFLAPRVPYPPDKGERIRAFHELEFLGRRHTVDLLCLADSVGEAARTESLLPFCRNIFVGLLRSRETLPRAVWNLMRDEPLSTAFFSCRELQRQLHATVAAENYDVIVVFGSAMGQYIPEPPCPPIVTDFVDVDSAKWVQYANYCWFPMSQVYAREARHLGAYEEKIAMRSSRSIVISDQEAAQLRAPGNRVTVVGNGVPSALTEEVAVVPEEIRRLQPYLVFIGTMDYFPNVDAVVHFAHDILPRIRERHPELKFVIVGRNPSRRVRRLARLPRVLVTGTVPNIAPYLRGAAVAVAPFRISQGIHNKILEALAAAIPVVCTSRPAEAIIEPLRELLIVADTSDDFAKAVVSLIENPNMRQQYGVAPESVREHLSWEAILVRFERVLFEVARRHSYTAATQES